MGKQLMLPGFEQEVEHEDPMDESPSEVDDAQWRARALAAEARLEQAKEELNGAITARNASEQSRQLERLLTAHGAVDIETALVMAQGALDHMETPDAQAAVSELRRTKPFLFAKGPRTSSMSEHAARETSPIDKAAHHARMTGDRKALLHYLRLKRAR